MTMARLAAVVAFSVLAGCASLEGPHEAPQRAKSEPERVCREWYRALDESIDAAGVRDAQYARVKGFAYFRADRLLASLRNRASASTEAFQAFTEHLIDLDLDARRYEIANLPPTVIQALVGADGQSSAASMLSRSRECSLLLREADLATPEARAALLQAVHVPDDYSDAKRALGLYPITSIVFFNGVRRSESEQSEAFRAGASLPAGAALVRYAPPPSPAIARAAVEAIFERTDALGYPLLSAREFERIAAAYAPSFEIAITGDYDRFGELRWRRDAASVDAAQAAVYAHPAYTRYGDRILLQLVYTVWFPERPPLGEVDLLAGRLDGVVWRATLAPDGEPVIYDSIHPCGCYHVFFPTPRARALPGPERDEEWAFVPQVLGRIREGERPVLRIASRTHYIEGVTVTRGADSVSRYALRDYDELRSLPKPGGRRSVFGQDGLIAGTERGERFLFWPMGIESAGAMRQWGRHATAFVGRRHFDDADLLERRFELDLGERDR
jgi:hypothetical protein